MEDPRSRRIPFIGLNALSRVPAFPAGSFPSYRRPLESMTKKVHRLPLRRHPDPRKTVSSRATVRTSNYRLGAGEISIGSPAAETTEMRRRSNSSRPANDYHLPLTDDAISSSRFSPLPTIKTIKMNSSKGNRGVNRQGHRNHRNRNDNRFIQMYILWRKINERKIVIFSPR